jgi:hypothetical protein
MDPGLTAERPAGTLPARATFYRAIALSVGPNDVHLPLGLNAPPLQSKVRRMSAYELFNSPFFLTADVDYVRG